jgi:hypothetical protein
MRTRRVPGGGRTGAAPRACLASHGFAGRAVVTTAGYSSVDFALAAAGLRREQAGQQRRIQGSRTAREYSAGEPGARHVSATTTEARRRVYVHKNQVVSIPRLLGSCSGIACMYVRRVLGRGARRSNSTEPQIDPQFIPTLARLSSNKNIYIVYIYVSLVDQ